MFTGLVEDRGTVVSIELGVESAVIGISTVLAPKISKGDSVSVNGVCLTAIEVSGDGFSADVMIQTLRLTTLGSLKVSDPVNLELAAPSDGRLGGHIVQGHVDGVGEVALIQPEVKWTKFVVKVPGSLARYIVNQGSIAIDAQIESAQGLVNCEAIARHPRVRSLNFGPADFMADLGMTSEEVTSNEYALVRVLVAARAAGKAAIDGPTLEVRDITKFEKSARISAAMGFDGKWVLHPDQIESCHRVFTPSQERFDEASCLVEAYEYFTSQAGGAKGAAIYKGAMIDEASRKMALTTCARGRAAGLSPSRHFQP